MICCECEKARNKECPIVEMAYSQKFEVNKCENFCEIDGYKYKHLIENEPFFKLIYEYFTDNVSDETKDAMVKAIINTGRKYGQK